MRWDVLYVTKVRGTKHQYTFKKLGEVEGDHVVYARKEAMKQWADEFKPTPRYPLGRITLRPENHAELLKQGPEALRKVLRELKEEEDASIVEAEERSGDQPTRPADGQGASDRGEDQGA